MSNLTLSFYKVVDSAYIPEFATEGAACFDFKASLVEGQAVKYYDELNRQHTIVIDEWRTLVLSPRRRYLVPINIIMDIPEWYSVRIHPRSGLALKKGITLLNCEGVIDSDYVDPTYITLYNASEEADMINDGDRIAQGELIRSEKYAMTITDVKPVQKTSRTGGFGSTGVS